MAIPLRRRLLPVCIAKHPAIGEPAHRAFVTVAAARSLNCFTMQTQTLCARSSSCSAGFRTHCSSRIAAAFSPGRLQQQTPRTGLCLQQHLAVVVQQQQQQQQLLPRRAPLQQSRLARPAAAASSSGGQPQQQPPSGWLGWFDRLPPRVQLGIMGGLLFVGMFVIPFLQPTFLYGDGNKQAVTAGQPGVMMTDVREAEDPNRIYTLPRYIPGASELYEFLQVNAMPRVGPDGRSESPGVLRIYMSSMIILALFYACSAALSLILRGVAGVLRAMGVPVPASPPPPKPDQE